MKRVDTFHWGIERQTGRGEVLLAASDRGLATKSTPISRKAMCGTMELEPGTK